MSDSEPATSTPAAKAATTRSRSDTSGCADCGWPFGPDLHQEWVLGRLLLLCLNPWACWGRQAEIRHRAGLDPRD